MKARTKLFLVVAAGAGALWLWARPRDRESEAVERVAEVEHEQWMAWLQTVAPEVSRARRERWEKLWIPYKDLPEAEKEKDREWARKALAAARR